MTLLKSIKHYYGKSEALLLSDSNIQNSCKEILNQIPNIDIFINGIGSSGTISGVGEILKQENENIQVIGVEPASSPLI